MDFMGLGLLRILRISRALRSFRVLCVQIKCFRDFSKNFGTSGTLGALMASGIWGGRLGIVAILAGLRVFVILRGFTYQEECAGCTFSLGS